MRKARISHYCISILAFFILQISPNPAYAIDPNDLTKPTYTITQIGQGSNDLNVIIFKVEAVDDKNGVRLQDWRSGTEKISHSAFDFWTVGANSSNLAPACTLPNQMPRVLIMDQNPPNRNLDFASKSNSYYLIMFIDGIKFPDGCPTSELKFTSSFSTLSIMDEAKNYALIVYPQKEFVIPAKKTTGSLCFSFDDNSLTGNNPVFARYTRFNGQLDGAEIKYPSSKASFENIRSKLAIQFSTYASNLQVYSNFVAAPFNLDAFLKLPLCKYTEDILSLSDSLNSATSEFQDLFDSLQSAADKAAADKAAADKAAADKAAAKPVAKDKTIICAKGKTSLKVIGTNPRCPAGYKVKK